MDINNVIKDYVTCVTNDGVTLPDGGSWISALCIYYNITEPVNGSWLVAYCNYLGITSTVNGSWTIALAQYLGISAPVNGSWWYAIADEACNGGIKPVANFTSDVITIAQGGTVQFTDTSTVGVGGPAITQWDWVFQDGTPLTSSAQNPAVVYNKVGNFDVSLTVTNADGNNTKTVLQYMTVTVVPVVADFSADTVTPIEGGTVNFTDLSTGTPTQWDWTLTGATPATSNVQNPAVVYSTAGTYTVALTASKTGSTDTETKVDYITVSTATPPAPITEFATGKFYTTVKDPTTRDAFATGKFATKQIIN
jgi:PKD repeat protein